MQPHDGYREEGRLFSDPNTEDDLKRRTPDIWYGLASPVGWDTIVELVHQELLKIDPDYEVHQIKEKFGELRYYSSIDGTQQARAILDFASNLSLRTCQNCGATINVKACHLGGQITTLCRNCFDLNVEYAREHEMNLSRYVFDGDTPATAQSKIFETLLNKEDTTSN